MSEIPQRCYKVAAELYAESYRICREQLAEAKRDNEQLKQCCESLHAILKERNCCTPEDYFDIDQMVKTAMKGQDD